MSFTEKLPATPTFLTPLGSDVENLVFSGLDISSRVASSKTCRRWREIASRKVVWKLFATNILKPADEEARAELVQDPRKWYGDRYSGELFLYRSARLPGDFFFPYGFDYSGEQLFCASQDSKIHVYNLKDLAAVKHTATIPCEEAYSLAISKGVLAVGSKKDFSVKMIALDNCKLLKTLTCSPPGEACALIHREGQPCGMIHKVAHNGKKMATLTWCSPDVNIWDISNNALLRTIPRSSAGSRSIRRFELSEERLFIKYKDGLTDIWNIETGDSMSEKQLHHCVSAYTILGLHGEKELEVDFRDATASSRQIWQQVIVEIKEREKMLSRQRLADYVMNRVPEEQREGPFKGKLDLCMARPAQIIQAIQAYLAEKWPSADENLLE